MFFITKGLVVCARQEVRSQLTPILIINRLFRVMVVFCWHSAPPSPQNHVGACVLTPYAFFKDKMRGSRIRTFVSFPGFDESFGSWAWNSRLFGVFAIIGLPAAMRCIFSGHGISGGVGGLWAGACESQWWLSRWQGRRSGLSSKTFQTKVSSSFFYAKSCVLDIIRPPNVTCTFFLTIALRHQAGKNKVYCFSCQKRMDFWNIRGIRNSNRRQWHH